MVHGDRVHAEFHRHELRGPRLNAQVGSRKASSGVEKAAGGPTKPLRD